MRQKLADTIDTLDSKRKEEFKRHQAPKTPHQPFSDAREEKNIRKKFKSLGYMD
jgi:hypothetical protein